jgi:hypothetical protein
VTRPGRIGLAVVVALFALTGVAMAQPAAPLTATLFLDSPPANVTFDGATPIRIRLQLRNVSGSDLITSDGFSSTDFWRQLIFRLDGVGFITNPGTADKHALASFGTCHYRKGVLVPGIQVVPVEVLPAGFAVEFTFDDARTQFDLTRPGRYLASATIPFLRYQPAAVIDDCDVEFGSTRLLSVGTTGAVGRDEFGIASNTIEFFVRPPDTVPPVTTVTLTPPGNAAGWVSQDVTADFSAVDNPGGSGAKAITVTLFGGQTGTQTLAGSSGTVVITGEGVTTIFFGAEDNAGNSEPTQSLTVRLDRTPPAVTPPAGITVTATEAGGARGNASPALGAFLAGGTATDNLDSAPARLAPQVGGQDVDGTTLFPAGTTNVAFRFRDVAGNTGSANASVTVTTAAGPPEIAVAIVGKGAHGPGVQFYDLRFTNSGSGQARAVTLQEVTPRVLAGVGAVRYNSGLSPRLPLALGDLAPGASRTIRIFLTVPLTVTRFSLTERGQFRDGAGTTLTFSVSQTLR